MVRCDVASLQYTVAVFDDCAWELAGYHRSSGYRLMPSLVYKIIQAEDWHVALASGRYDGSQDDRRDGFIHLSTFEQLEGTADRHFRGQAGLMLVEFEAAALEGGLRFEPSRGGALFPHYYGSLPVDQALWVRPMKLGADGVPRATAGTDDADGII